MHLRKMFRGIWFEWYYTVKLENSVFLKKYYNVKILGRLNTYVEI